MHKFRVKTDLRISSYSRIYSCVLVDALRNNTVYTDQIVTTCMQYHIMLVYMVGICLAWHYLNIDTYFCNIFRLNMHHIMCWCEAKSVVSKLAFSNILFFSPASGTDQNENFTWKIYFTILCWFYFRLGKSFMINSWWIGCTKHRQAYM